MNVLSVIVPIFRCDSTLVPLYERIRVTLDSIGRDFELILVHDGCSMSSWRTIENLVRSDRRVRGLRLSRNFGQHPAIMAGMRCARGSLIAVLDCDLQDPVETLPQYLALAETSDVVLSVRTERADGAVRKLQSHVYAFALRTITGQSVDPRLGGISVLSSKVAAEYVKFNEPDHHFQYILKWLGFSTECVEIERSERVSGRSSYSFRSRLRHTSSGLFFFPARIVGFVAGMGIAVFLLGVLLVAIILVSSLNATPVSGWLSTISLIVLFSGFNVGLTAVVGIYVMRTFEKVKERPLYVIDEVV